MYDTADPLFWRELAKENMRIHKESGTKGKCIEGRELIIALPEPLTEKDPNELLRGIVEVFRKKYGVDCIAALHHNKRKTNYHIHLIFSERKRKEVVNEKIATRNMFYDENGKHVRTKKEILDENGNIRDGCYIIKKGEVYERDIFSAKDKQFKSKAFLKEAKVYLMDHINTLLPEGYPKLTIFDDEEVYLPMLKIGKNNPKEAEIIAANELRTAWNQIADQAMVEGVPQADIKKIKQVEIMEAARKSIKEHGKEPGRFNRILREAMQHLRKLILKIRDAVKIPEVVVPEVPIHHKSEIHTDVKKPVIPEKPVEPELSKRFKSYYATYKKLEGVGKEIRKLEDKLETLQKELSQTTGFFKGKERNRIIGEIADTQVEISQKRASLSKIAIKAKCGSVDDFYTKYNASKASHNEYMKKYKAWEDKYGSGEGTSTPKDEPKGKETPKKTQENVSTPKRMLNMVSMKAELQKKKEVVKERDEHREPTIIKKKENNIGLE
ncbi:MAG: MobA/MobL family protein [Butyrivibrio sp.]|nr:MobA/MobL family protein [Butyrivibrio sp.]